MLYRVPVLDDILCSTDGESDPREFQVPARRLPLLYSLSIETRLAPCDVLGGIHPGPIAGMSIWDDRILGYVRERDGATVSELAKDDRIRVSNVHVSRRYKKLDENELIRPIGNGAYGITEEGEGYLDGEHDAENHVFRRGT